MTAAPRRPRRVAGCSLAEALVAAALAAVALAGLSVGAGLAVRSLVLARDIGVALAAATERLEALRAGPRSDGADVRPGPGGTPFTRRWSVAGGRGRPVALSVEVAWGGHTLRLATEVFP